MLKTQFTNDELAAGIKSFERFGVMNMVRALAKDMKLTFPQVMLVDYNTAFIVMQMMSEERKFRRSYSEILKPKK